MAYLAWYTPSALKPIPTIRTSAKPSLQWRTNTHAREIYPRRLKLGATYPHHDRLLPMTYDSLGQLPDFGVLVLILQVLERSSRVRLLQARVGHGDNLIVTNADVVSEHIQIPGSMQRGRNDKATRGECTVGGGNEGRKRGCVSNQRFKTRAEIGNQGSRRTRMNNLSNLEFPRPQAPHDEPGRSRNDPPIRMSPDAGLPVERTQGRMKGSGPRAACSKTNTAEPNNAKVRLEQANPGQVDGTSWRHRQEPGSQRLFPCRKKRISPTR